VNKTEKKTVTEFASNYIKTNK